MIGFKFNSSNRIKPKEPISNDNLNILPSNGMNSRRVLRNRNTTVKTSLIVGMNTKRAKPRYNGSPKKNNSIPIKSNLIRSKNSSTQRQAKPGQTESVLLNDS